MRRRSSWMLGGVGCLALFVMVTASAIVSRTDKGKAEPVRTILEQVALPGVSVVDTGSSAFVSEERVQRSDTVAALFSRLGISDPDALGFINQNPDARTLARQLRPGNTVTARTGPDGTLAVLYLPVNNKDALFAIERKDGKFTGSEQAMPLVTRTLFGSGEIVSSLFAATDEAGVPDPIASQLADIFSGDIDFHRDLRKGDKFTVIFESLVYNGQHIRSGRILAAEFVNNDRAYQAYWFHSENDKGGYYTREGQSLRKAFLRSPLEFSRITSGFSTARFHPILQTIREHKGIDYAAPTGTRVRAVADGIVEFAGQQSGFGNIIILKHHGLYSTAYGHLNGFAPEIHRGMRVSQGDTIGFVGQTGLATGPHLHYEFRNNGQQVNPMTAISPEPTPLDAAQLARFREASAPLFLQLDLVKQAKTGPLASAM